MRRYKDNVRFTSTFKISDQVSSKEFVLSAPKGPPTELQNFGPSFTSEHGITVNFAEDDDSDYDELFHAPEKRNPHNVLYSTEHVLIVALCDMTNCCGEQFSIYVKYKNSEEQYELRELLGTEKPHFYTLGNHIFMSILFAGHCGDDVANSTFFYVSENGILELGQEYGCTPLLAVYDGLFHVLKPDRYYVYQTNLEAQLKESSVKIEMTVEKSYREDDWDPYLSVVDTAEGLFVFDVRKGELEEAKEVDGEVVVDGEVSG